VKKEKKEKKKEKKEKKKETKEISVKTSVKPSVQPSVPVKQSAVPRHLPKFIEEKGKIESLVGQSSSDLIYFKNCEDCQYTIPKGCTKVILEKCKNTSITINGAIRTGTLEIIRCQSIKMNLKTTIPTITIDISNDIHLDFSMISQFQNIISTRCSQLTLGTEEDKPYLVPCDENTIAPHDWLTNQYVTHVVEGKICTEQVIREAAGYATTVREKEINDQKQQKIEEAVSKFFTSVMSLKDK